MTAPDEFRLTPGESNEFNEIANFNRIPNEETPVNHHTEHIDPYPYGPPTQPLKPGLNPRGKAALGISAVVIASGSLIGYQAYSSNAAEKEAQASAIQLEMQKLKLEELKEQNRAKETGRTAEKKVNSTLQASIDKCVNRKEDHAEKNYIPYRDIVDACKAQYSTAAADTGTDLENASSSQPAGDTSGINTSLALGVVGLAVVVGALAARRGTKTTPTA